MQILTATTIRDNDDGFGWEAGVDVRDDGLGGTAGFEDGESEAWGVIVIFFGSVDDGDDILESWDFCADDDLMLRTPL